MTTSLNCSATSSVERLAGLNFSDMLLKQASEDQQPEQPQPTGPVENHHLYGWRLKTALFSQEICRLGPTQANGTVVSSEAWWPENHLLSTAWLISIRRQTDHSYYAMLLLYTMLLYIKSHQHRRQSRKTNTLLLKHNQTQSAALHITLRFIIIKTHLEPQSRSCKYWKQKLMADKSVWVIWCIMITLFNYPCVETRGAAAHAAEFLHLLQAFRSVAVRSRRVLWLSFSA